MCYKQGCPFVLLNGRVTLVTLRINLPNRPDLLEISVRVRDSKKIEGARVGGRYSNVNY